jgi:hypothetical protein
MPHLITREAQLETFCAFPEAIVAHPLSPSARLQRLDRIVTALNTGASTPGTAKALTTALADKEDRA